MLYMTGEVSPVFFAPLIFGYLLRAAGWKKRHEEFVENALGFIVFILVILFIALTSLGYIHVLHGAAGFVLITSFFRVIGPQRGRQLSQIVLLSLFEILASATLTGEIYFGGFIILYLFAVPWAMIFVNYAERKNGEITVSRLRKMDFVALIFLLSTSSALITAAVFVLFPRVKTPFFKSISIEENLISGFSDTVELGDTGKILMNSRVVMRVIPLQSSEKWKNRVLYLRSRVYTTYKGGRWSSVRMPEGYLKSISKDTYFIPSFTGGSGAISSLKVVMEFIPTHYFFLPYGSLYLKTSERKIAYNDLGEIYPGVSNLPPPAYTLEGYFSTPLKSAGVLALNVKSEYLSVEKEIQPALERFVKKSGLGGKPEEVAQFLRDHFTYTLEIKRQDLTLDPLLDFLFNVKSGNCELFATAGALMLRLLGIPSRLVAGFVVREWNTLGNYFTVRERNAHTWVEYFDDDEHAWKIMDPTPPSELKSVKTSLSLKDIYDYLKFLWLNYVLEYSLSTQVKAVKKIEKKIFPAGRRSPALTIVIRRQKMIIGIIIAVGILFFLWRKGLRFSVKLSSKKEMLPQQVRRMEKVIRVLERKTGVRRRPSETPLEYLEGLRLKLTDDQISSVKELILNYYMWRYGGAGWHMWKRDFNIALRKIK